MPLENITDADYTAFYFNKFSTDKVRNLDYQIIVADSRYSKFILDWKHPYLAEIGPIIRYEPDLFHESILKKFAAKLNPEASKYKLYITKAELPREKSDDKKPDKPERPSKDKKLYNQDVFSAFVIALVG